MGALIFFSLLIGAFAWARASYRRFEFEEKEERRKATRRARAEGIIFNGELQPGVETFLDVRSNAIVAIVVNGSYGYYKIAPGRAYPASADPLYDADGTANFLKRYRGFLIDGRPVDPIQEDRSRHQFTFLVESEGGQHSILLNLPQGGSHPEGTLRLVARRPPREILERLHRQEAERRAEAAERQAREDREQREKDERERQRRDEAQTRMLEDARIKKLKRQLGILERIKHLEYTFEPLPHFSNSVHLARHAKRYRERLLRSENAILKAHSEFHADVEFIEALKAHSNELYLRATFPIRALARAQRLDVMPPAPKSASASQVPERRKPTPEEVRAHAMERFDVEIADLTATVRKRHEAGKQLEVLLDEASVVEMDREPYRQALDGIFARKREG